MKTHPDICLATVLLEKNRWSSKEPSFALSEWLAPIADAGFDGLELWENHLLKADPAETDAVRAGPLPVKVLNTYCGFDDESAEARAQAATLARKVNAGAVKFNFGNKPELAQRYRDNLLAWREDLPKGCRLLCECHPYTILEEPDQAAAVLAPLLDEIEIIVHAFGGEDADLQKRIDLFGSRITHVHAAGGGMDGFRYSPLGDSPRVPKRIAMLRDAGFAGSWSIEFTNGVASPGESVPALLEAAADDARALRKELAC